MFLPGKSHEGRSLVGYSPWDSKESDTTKRLHVTSSNLTLESFRDAKKVGDGLEWIIREFSSNEIIKYFIISLASSLVSF